MDCIAIDFETANEQRSSPCSVGVVVIEGGEVAKTFYRLIKPKGNYFNGFNISILPRTEVVGFTRESNDEPVMADFDKVLDRLGHLITPADMYPPRYRATDFPTDDDLAALVDESK